MSPELRILLWVYYGVVVVVVVVVAVAVVVVVAVAVVVVVVAVVVVVVVVGCLRQDFGKRLVFGGSFTQF